MSTIAVDETVHHRLLHLKEEWGTNSLNDVIHKLMDQIQPVPASMFGVDPGLPHLDRKTRDEMWA